MTPIEFAPVLRGQNRTHYGVLARFHLQNRTHARVLALFDTEQWPERRSDFNFPGAIVLKRHSDFDFAPKIEKFGENEDPNGVKNRWKLDLGPKIQQNGSQDAFTQKVPQILVDFGTILGIPNGSEIVKNPFWKVFPFPIFVYFYFSIDFEQNFTAFTSKIEIIATVCLKKFSNIFLRSIHYKLLDKNYFIFFGCVVKKKFTA